jgi:hypothetical protein
MGWTHPLFNGVTECASMKESKPFMRTEEMGP